MKISYSLVLGAFLGTISHSELVAAVERHHHHHHDYVQFIPDIHHEGVVMLKDLGYDSRTGYPYQSFAEPTGGDIKSPKVEVPVEKPKPAADVAKDKEVEDANKAIAEKQE